MPDNKRTHLWDYRETFTIGHLQFQHTTFVQIINMDDFCYDKNLNNNMLGVAGKGFHLFLLSVSSFYQVRGKFRLEQVAKKQFPTERCQ